MNLAKLIYRTNATYLPTVFPAHYYGMPNGKIYLFFSRFYEAAIGNTGLEFVFAEHKEFAYNYENETIFPLSEPEQKLPVFEECVDCPRSKIKVFSISRFLKSYAQAQAFLNKHATGLNNTKRYGITA